MHAISIEVHLLEILKKIALESVPAWTVKIRKMTVPDRFLDTIINTWQSTSDAELKDCSKT